MKCGAVYHGFFPLRNPEEDFYKPAQHLWADAILLGVLRTND